MNDVRRKAIRKVIEMISDARMMLDELREEENDYMNNIPENLTGSERYEKAEEAVYEMEEAVSSLEEMEMTLEGGDRLTRKRFWRLRNALNIKLKAWGAENVNGTYSGVDDKKMRPVSGKPLVDFSKADRYNFGKSYAEAWEGLKFLRDGLGM